MTLWSKIIVAHCSAKRGCRGALPASALRSAAHALLVSSSLSPCTTMLHCHVQICADHVHCRAKLAADQAPACALWQTAGRPPNKVPCNSSSKATHGPLAQHPPSFQPRTLEAAMQTFMRLHDQARACQTMVRQALPGITATAGTAAVAVTAARAAAAGSSLWAWNRYLSAQIPG